MYRYLVFSESDPQRKKFRPYILVDRAHRDYDRSVPPSAARAWAVRTYTTIEAARADAQLMNR